MRIYYCDHYCFPLPAGHKFPLAKYRLIRERLAEEGGFDFHKAPLATEQEIALTHQPAYVRQFLEGTLPPWQMRRIGFPWSEALVRRTLASVGATLAAARHALHSHAAGCLSGGTHHAHYAEGAGFCVFNDVAVAINRLRGAGLIRRAAVIDLDVHQGDGTAALFRHVPEVFTFSMHCSANFPFRKQESDLDISLPPGIGGPEFLALLQSALPQVLETKPEIVFYLAGVDPLNTDRLGRLALTMEDLRRRDWLVLSTIMDSEIPLVITLGGGYSEPMQIVVEAHANTFLMARDLLQRKTPAL
jgi:acetoin utilization deacetylase AcuC-like enzyme